MIDATFHARQRDRLFKRKSLPFRPDTHDATAKGDDDGAAEKKAIHFFMTANGLSRFTCYCIGELTLSNPPTRSPSLTALAKSFADPRPQ